MLLIENSLLLILVFLLVLLIKNPLLLMFSQQVQWALASSLCRVTHSELKIDRTQSYCNKTIKLYVYRLSVADTLNKIFYFGGAVQEVWRVGDVLVAVYELRPL